MDVINPSDQKSEFEELDRSETEGPARDDHSGSMSEEAEKPARSEKPAQQAFRTQLWLSMLQRLATLAILLLAVLISVVTWDPYVTSPWTRDGRVRVQVASVAPEISGRIVAVSITDNQLVHKGDLLYHGWEVGLTGRKSYF
jgi:hypothetical protein